MDTLSEEQWRNLAAQLDAMSLDTGSDPFYDMMSDALVWRDEVPLSAGSPPTCDTDPLDVLRYVWHHRTRLILQQPSPYGETWDRVKSLAPNWIGFGASRCTPCDALARRFEQLSRKSQQSLDAAD